MDENARRKKERLIALLEEQNDEESFQNAKEFLEEALAAGEDADLLREYGYIHECRGSSLIREAISWYERSLELDPASNNEAHHQLINAYARLLQHGDAIDRYRQRLAAGPENVVEYRFLVQAYLAAGEYEEAGKVIDAGLALDENDLSLLESRGSVFSGQGRPEEALAVWQQVFDLDPDRTISPRYSRVFLLQRLGRLEEAAAEWEAIIAWLLERDYTVETEWPKRELAGVRARITGVV